MKVAWHFCSGEELLLFDSACLHTVLGQTLAEAGTAGLRAFEYIQQNGSEHNACFATLRWRVVYTDPKPGNSSSAPPIPPLFCEHYLISKPMLGAENPSLSLSCWLRVFDPCAFTLLYICPFTFTGAKSTRNPPTRSCHCALGEKRWTWARGLLLPPNGSFIAPNGFFNPYTSLTTSPSLLFHCQDHFFFGVSGFKLDL